MAGGFGSSRKRFQQSESLLHPVFSDDKSANLTLVIGTALDHFLRFEGYFPVQFLTLRFSENMQR